MRNIPDKLREHLNQDILTIATCIKILKQDQQELYYTDCQQNIVFNGNLYRKNTIHNIDKIENINSLDANSLNITLNKDAMNIDLINAEIEIFFVNYMSPNDGKIVIKDGIITSYKMVDDNQLSLTVKDILAKLKTNITNFYSKECRANIGDDYCKLDRSKYIIELEILDVIDGVMIIIDDKYQNFLPAIQSVILNDRKFYITGFDDEYLYLNTPYKEKVKSLFGKFQLDCKGDFDRCCSIFNNAINFRGEPHLPENIEILHS